MRRCRQATMTMAVGVVISLMQDYLASSLYPDKAGNSIVKTAESNYLFLVILICIAKYLFTKALLYFYEAFIFGTLGFLLAPPHVQ